MSETKKAHLSDCGFFGLELLPVHSCHCNAPAPSGSVEGERDEDTALVTPEMLSEIIASDGESACPAEVVGMAKLLSARAAPSVPREGGSGERDGLRSALIRVLVATPFPQVDHLSTALGIDFRDLDSEDKIADALLALRAAPPVPSEVSKGDVEAALVAFRECPPDDTDQAAMRRALASFGHDAVSAAARALVDKLALIHADPRYQGIWTMAALHGALYDGPKYVEELAALTAALEARRAG